MRQLSFSSQVIILILLFSVNNLSLKAQERKLEIDDYFKLKSVQDPQISPDGEWVAYTVRETDLEKDKSETSVWMVPYNGGEALRMTSKGSSAGRPRWSPDGKYLSFTANRNDSKNQVWGLDRRGGEAQQLTHVKQGVGSYSWSPDGKHLLLSIRDEKEESKEEKEKPKPWVIDRLQMKRDYAGYLDSLNTQLYVQELGDTNLVQLTTGKFDASSPVWSPDGKQVAFVSNRTENPDANSNTDIWIVDVDTPGELRQLTTNPGSDNSPAWSSDGQSITYVTGIQPELIWYATNHLAVISVEEGKAEVLSKKLDRNVRNPQFSPDGKSIYFQLEDDGERHLAQMTIRNKRINRLVKGTDIVNGFTMLPDGKMALLLAGPQQPAEVFSFSEEAAPSQLSTTNQEILDSLQLGQMEAIRFKSKDGTAISGFTVKPPDFEAGKTYPTLLRIHGGPVSQYSHSFNFEAQLFAAKGYLVVMTNPRGSSGKGQDFSKALFGDWGNKDFEDVMAGVDYVIEQGMADPERLGVGGWSYGGILTNYVITKTDRFKGAISGASEVLYIANYGHDHYQLQWEKELGLPWENRELWEKISPFNYVTNVKTPTLIMGGEKDWNVPILNSEQLYQALKRLGVETQLVVYPGEHHGIRTPTFVKDRYQRYLDWYERYVMGLDE